MAHYLKDYQREGVTFFYEALMQHRGALLGDNMGCGKTVQMAALLRKEGKECDRARVQQRERAVDVWYARTEQQVADALAAGHPLDEHR